MCLNGLRPCASMSPIKGSKWSDTAPVRLAMWNLARDYALYADLFKRKGDLSKAQENVTKAIEIFEECGADGWVDKYEKELAEL